MIGLWRKNLDEELQCDQIGGFEQASFPIITSNVPATFSESRIQSTGENQNFGVLNPTANAPLAEWSFANQKILK